MLVKQVSGLQLSCIEGEDVEHVVRLVKATYTVLCNASSCTHSYIPLEFTKMVYELFQTSSVSEFNNMFLTEQQKIQVQADKSGIQPVWPSLTVVCRLATATYHRLKANGTWDGIVDKKKNKAYLGSPSSTTPRSGSRSTEWSTYCKCSVICNHK